jgi:hypothetical protein
MFNRAPSGRGGARDARTFWLATWPVPSPMYRNEPVQRMGAAAGFLARFGTCRRFHRALSQGRRTDRMAPERCWLGAFGARPEGKRIGQRPDSKSGAPQGVGGSSPLPSADNTLQLFLARGTPRISRRRTVSSLETRQSPVAWSDSAGFANSAAEFGDWFRVGPLAILPRQVRSFARRICRFRIYNEELVH